MITAIVMIDCHVDQIPEAAATIADIPGVNKVYSVTGDSDLIAILHLSKYDDLADVVSDSMAKVPGVTAMQTHLAFRTYSKSDLEEAFHLGLD